MIKGFAGGWDALAYAMAMSRNALENRVYKTKRQTMSVDDALLMQKMTGTTLFAEAVAASSGGAFVKLPVDLVDGNEMLAKKFREVYVCLGQFAERLELTTADDVIDERERADLDAIMDGLQRTLAEMMALMCRVYCAPAVAQGGMA